MGDDGAVLGTFRVVTPAANAGRAVVTEILDPDADRVLRIVRLLGRRRLGVTKGAAQRGGFRVFDSAGSVTASFQPRWGIVSARLRVAVEARGLSGGSLRHERAVLAKRGVQAELRYRILAHDGGAVATVTARFAPPSSFFHALAVLEVIDVSLEVDTVERWGSVAVALATCLPQFGIGATVEVPGGSSG